MALPGLGRLLPPAARRLRSASPSFSELYEDREDGGAAVSCAVSFGRGSDDDFASSSAMSADAWTPGSTKVSGAAGLLAGDGDRDRAPAFGPPSMDTTPERRGGGARALDAVSTSSESAMDSSRYGGRAGPGGCTADRCGAMDDTRTKLAGGVRLESPPEAGADVRGVEFGRSPPRAAAPVARRPPAPRAAAVSPPAAFLAPPTLGGAFLAPPRRGPKPVDDLDGTSHGAAFSAPPRRGPQPADGLGGAAHGAMRSASALDLAGLHPGLP